MARSRSEPPQPPRSRSSGVVEMLRSNAQSLRRGSADRVLAIGGGRQRQERIGGVELGFRGGWGELMVMREMGLKENCLVFTVLLKDWGPEIHIPSSQLEG